MYRGWEKGNIVLTGRNPSQAPRRCDSFPGFASLNPGAELQHSPLFPDFASLNPGYGAKPSRALR
jgi:hypothetical protein